MVIINIKLFYIFEFMRFHFKICRLFIVITISIPKMVATENNNCVLIISTKYR